LDIPPLSLQPPRHLVEQESGGMPGPVDRNRHCAVVIAHHRGAMRAHRKCVPDGV
jgi:hypothetical protein